MFNGLSDEDERRFQSLGLAGFNFNLIQSRNFKESYRAFACDELVTSNKSTANYGGKLFLPPSVLVKISEQTASYPMLFQLASDKGKVSYAGVLEFIAEEGRVYLPRWMMASLEVNSGEILEVQTASMPLGKFVKIQPQSPDFLDITDPKAVLENAFRNFTCLTKGEIIQINYNEALYEILVMEIKPEGEAITIVETDLEVDFAEPLGYVEPTRPSSTTSSLPSTAKIEALEKSMQADNSFSAFKGEGNRIKTTNRRKPQKVEDDADSEVLENKDLSIAPLKLPFGNLFFGYRIVPDPNAPTAIDEDQNQQGDGKDNGEAFGGLGNKLR